MPRPVILTLCDYYLPGFRGGGLIASVANLVEQLSGEFRFRIVTRNRDLGERKAYENVAPYCWRRLGEAEVCYLPDGGRSAVQLKNVLRDEAYAALYLNSLFSPMFSLWPLCLRKSGRLPTRPVVLAPRGELSPGALQLKAAKKQLLLKAARAVDLHRDVLWQASAEAEMADIQRDFGPDARIAIAPDLPSAGQSLQDAIAFVPKPAGRIKLVFLSRISPKKNLLGALELLHGLRGDVELTIVGPPEDAAYWQRCQQTIATLPENVVVHVAGPVTPSEVPGVMADHDMFLFPTLGENFGHVILEAISAGCPVLVSDQTPWRNLAELGAGWDLPIDNTDGFRQILQRSIDMDAAGFERLRRSVLAYARAYHARTEDEVRLNADLFWAALDRPRVDEVVNRAA